MFTKHLIQNQNNIRHAQQLMKISPKLTYTQTQSRLQQIEENWNTTLHPICPLQIKTGYEWQQKVYKLMETEWLTTEWKIDQEKIKDFLELNKNEYTMFPNLGNTVKVVLRSTKSLHEESWRYPILEAFTIASNNIKYFRATNQASEIFLW